MNGNFDKLDKGKVLNICLFLLWMEIKSLPSLSASTWYITVENGAFILHPKDVIVLKY